jgi:hypothetical protein
MTIETIRSTAETGFVVFENDAARSPERPQADLSLTLSPDYSTASRFLTLAIVGGAQ